VAKRRLRVRYNAPVTLTLALLSTAVLGYDQIFGSTIVTAYFTAPPYLVGGALTWVRLFTHVIGHASWAHLVSNFSFVLLIGPVLEEKYGSGIVLLMTIITAGVTGLLNGLLVHAGLLGASGIVFMLILLSSFTNIRAREIPLTFLLVVALYFVREFVAALTPDSVSQLTHIAGGLCGGLFGFLFARREPPATASGSGAASGTETAARPAAPSAGKHPWDDAPGDDRLG
jgi:membrane associated rhomboid family serine protease